MRTAQGLATPGTADHLDLRAVLVILACCLCWGGGQVAVKITNTGISPVLHAGMRSLFSGALLLAWAYARGIPLFGRDRTFWPGVLAGILFGLEFLVLFIGLHHTTASRGVVFLYTAPFWVALGAHYFIAGDRLTFNKVIGLAAALAGLMVAMGEGVFTPGRPTLYGDFLCALAALIWGVTTVLVRTTTLRSAAPEKTLFYQLAVSGLMLPLASWLMGEAGITDLRPDVLWAFAYSFIAVAFASFLAWFWLVRHYPPTRVSSFTFLAPVFGVLAGNLILGEAFTPSMALSLVLIAGGIYLVNRTPAVRESA